MGRTEIPDLSRLQGEPWLVATSFCFPLERVALSLERMPDYALDNADIVREAILRQLSVVSPTNDVYNQRLWGMPCIA